MSEQKYKLSFSGFFITFIAAIFFSTKAIIVKLAFAGTSANAIEVLTFRMIFALPFYLVAAFVISNKKENVKMTGRQWITVALIGMTGYYVSSLLDFVGLQFISAGLERLILFLYPTFAILINALFYKQKISRIQWIALILTYVGIAVAFYGELQIDEGNDNFLFGSIMILLCAIAFSIYLVGSGRLIPAIGSTKFTAYAMLAATAGIFAHFLVTSNIAALQQDNDLWLYGLLLALVATVIPSFLMSHGLKLIGSNNVAIINSIGPVSTVIQAHLLLGEKMFAAQIAGTFLVIVGVLLIGLKSRSIQND